MGNQQDVIKAKGNIDTNWIEGIDYLLCPICGLVCKKITGGHLRTHGYNINSFREVYGNIPTECESHIKLKSEKEKLVMSDESFRKKRSKTSKKLWEDPSIRNQRIDGIRKHHSDPSFREKASKNSKKVWKDVNTRERLIANMLEANKNPEVKKRRSENMLRLWGSEEFVRKVFDGQGRFSEYVLRFGKVLKLKSSYEVLVCEYLEDLELRFSYEPKRFHYILDGQHHSYYPDFYLEDFNLFLEVKPEVFQNDELVLKKFNSVKYYGENIIFVGESDIISKEALYNKIVTSSTTIP